MFKATIYFSNCYSILLLFNIAYLAYSLCKSIHNHLETNMTSLPRNQSHNNTVNASFHHLNLFSKSYFQTKSIFLFYALWLTMTNLL